MAVKAFDELRHAYIVLTDLASTMLVGFVAFVFDTAKVFLLQFFQDVPNVFFNIFDNISRAVLFLLSNAVLAMDANIFSFRFCSLDGGALENFTKLLM